MGQLKNLYFSVDSITSGELLNSLVSLDTAKSKNCCQPWPCNPYLPKTVEAHMAGQLAESTPRRHKRPPGTPTGQLTPQRGGKRKLLRDTEARCWKGPSSIVNLRS